MVDAYGAYALQLLHINVSLNRPPDRTWRRPPGRPRNKWIDQLRNDSTRPTGDLWRRAVDRGHGGATTRRYDRVRNDEVLQRTGLTSLYLGMWLFSCSTSTYHSTDLLTARGVAHLVVHGTSGSTSYETIPPVPGIVPYSVSFSSWARSLNE